MKKINMGTGLAGLVVSVLLMGSQANAVMFDFTHGRSRIYGQPSNERTFLSSDGATSVTVSSWSRSRGGDWNPGWLGHYSSGLGVTNVGRDNDHRVDNSPRRSGWDEFVVFEFSQDVIPDRVRLNSVGRDSDFSVWLSSVSPSDDINIQSDGDFRDTFGSRLENNFVNHGYNRWAGINGGDLPGNILVISPFTRFGTHGGNDSFKIGKLDVDLVSRVPEGGSAGIMFLSIILPVIVRRRR